MRHVHVITPGDHFSPRTGSAIPTVVHGLCAATPEVEPRPAVVVERRTYPERYDSADIFQYDGARPLPRLLSRVSRYVDAASGLVAGVRPLVGREWRAAVAGQAVWEPSFVVAHNAPQLPRYIDADRHRPVLYAHNHLLRSFTQRESGRSLDRVHRIVAVSEALAAQMSPHLPRHLRSRLAVVRNGVDNAFFARAPHLFERNGPLRVVYIGRMIEDKGADVLVRAVELMAQKKDVRVTLVGSSGFSASDPLTRYERGLQAYVDGTGGRVSLRPFVSRSQVPALLHEADVVVVPSRWPEPFALTVLEGMAAGAAVIASRIGGVPEAAGSAGLLVAPDDPAALAKALDEMVLNERLRQEMVQAGLAHAMERDWGRVRNEFVEALQE